MILFGTYKYQGRRQLHYRIEPALDRILSKALAFTNQVTVYIRLTILSSHSYSQLR